MGLRAAAVALAACAYAVGASAGLPVDAAGFEQEPWVLVEQQSVAYGQTPQWAPSTGAACAEAGYECGVRQQIYIEGTVDDDFVAGSYPALSECPFLPWMSCVFYVYRQPAGAGGPALAGTDLSNAAHVGQVIFVALLFLIGMHGWAKGSQS